MTATVPQTGADYARSPLLQHTGGQLRPGGLDLTDRLLRLAGCQPGERVLDLACGAGVSLAHLRREHGLRALGLDLSAELLQRSQSQPRVHADAACLPLQSGCLDAVLCECVLSLMPRTEDVLDEIQRVLTPGGWLLLTDIYLRAPDGSSEEPPACCLEGARGKNELGALLAQHGLRLEYWEDQTPRLTQLAAELVFAHGSLQAFWETMLPARAACNAAHTGRKRKPGYCLALARKAGL